VDDGAVGAGARDGVEAGIAQVAGLAAEFEQPVGGFDFVQPALGRFDRQPVEEASHRRAVAGLGGAVAGDFRFVLDRAGQDRRVAPGDDLGSGAFEGVEDPGHRALRVGDHRLAGQRREVRREGGAVVDSHRIAEVGVDVVADLLGRDEQVGGAVGVDQCEGERDRGVLDVLAATLKVQAIESSAERTGRVGFLLLEPIGHFGALGGGGLAGIGIGVDDERGLGRLRAVSPDGIDRVAATATSSAPFSASAALAFFTQSAVCSHGS
jgi:hypothetical protein